MKKFLILSLLLVSTSGGIALAIFLESCDLSQWELPTFLAQQTQVVAPADPQPEVAITTPTVHIDPAVRPASQIELEPRVTQQFDLEAIKKTLEDSQATQQKMADSQNRSWEVVNKAIDSMKEVATSKVETSKPETQTTAVQAPLPVEEAPAPSPSDNLLPRPTQPRIIPDEGDDKLTIVIQDSDIREVLELLSEQGQLNILPSQSVQGTVSASLTKVDVRTALAAILRSTGYVMQQEGDFIYVGTPADMQNMQRLQDQIGTRIYRLKYIRAIEVQTLITPMLTESVGSLSISTESKIGIAADANNPGSDDYAGVETVIIRDYEQNLAKIDRAILEIDCRPLQVAIEAMILSVQLDDSLDMGVSFEALRQNNNIRLISGFPPQSLASLDLTEGGLKLGYLDANLSLFVEALEAVGETNVIAAPQLLVLNKQRAEILIGEQKGYISTTVTETASTQSVEFLEVGTQLRIRPFITNDGMVRLDVHPEISTGEVRVESGLTIPDKEVTQVTTNIMCPDGKTVVIGGLIKSSQTKSTFQIPYLGSLPGAGLLFRQKHEELERQELIVLITPRIVDPNHINNDGEKARDLFELQHEYSADKMSPLSKRHIGRNYYRLATSAWATGDAYSALRYVNLAIHYDNQLLEAVALRDEITTQTGLGDRTVHSHLKEGLAPWNHPHGVQVSPWHLDQIESGPPISSDYQPPELIPNPRIVPHQ
ncbi:hypothetical protein C5Y96_21305 [Blastopirellula marina]|uniref:Type II/III secretion system secretin-like domain-containing protein n=1 Tax=Blastopirellula marina TaxID=124 RepID=A0A2S8F1E5_9BACT|nr:MULTISPECIES: hypothetical protein [Pirellulaceae]PQO25991.1 hypothetical protein C5Y96_21305 [Blastopirellula marina]RCS44349.1 hypothetical protein DTL36_21350 [Bremerella cremea]